jgi:hypothetical protein
MLVKDLLEILEIHSQARKFKNFANAPEFARLMNEFPSKAKSAIPNSNEIAIKASLGSGSASHTPFIGFYQEPMAKGAKNGLYIVTIFSADGEHCYLGLSHSGIWGGTPKLRSKFSKNYLAELRKAPVWDSIPAGLVEQAGIAGGSPTGKDSQASFILGFEIVAGTTDEEFVSKFEWLRKCLISLPVSSITNHSNLVGMVLPSNFEIAESSHEIIVKATNNPDISLESAALAALFMQRDNDIEMYSGVLNSVEGESDAYKLTEVTRTALHTGQLEVARELIQQWSDSLCFHEIGEQLWKTLTGKTMGNVSEVNSAITQALLTYRNVILEGVAGTGKTYALTEIEATGVFDSTTLVVLHQNYTYEDFVEGLKPIGDTFEVTNGVFTSACIEAASNPTKKYLLVLDEINRSNTAKVLGELLYLIEPSKRHEPEHAASILNSKNSAVFGDAGVLLGLSRPNVDGPYRLRLAMPSNLYLLGTMNTTDRSVGSLDLALRRRFVFMRIEPRTVEEMKDLLDDATLISFLPSWNKLNELLIENIGRDAQIGHSYFFEAEQAKSRELNEGSVHLFRDLILPQLCEILVTFGSVGLVETPQFQDLDFKGWTVKLEGRGLDRLPYVTSK